MPAEKLEKIGLSKNEAKIYTALLKLGPTPIGKITEYSNIHRRNVYDAVDRLTEKGLIGYTVKSKQKCFEATSPNRILKLIKDKEDIFLNVLPDLLNLQNRTKQNIRVFKGKEAYKIILDDVAESGELNRAIVGFVPRTYLHIVQKFHEKRIKNKIIDKILFHKSEADRGKNLSEREYTEVKFLPSEVDSPITLNIYDNKLGIFIWSKTDLIGIQIENEQVYNTFVEYFELLWEISKKE